MPVPMHYEQRIEAPKYLYKVISPEAWEESQNASCLILTVMDEEFVHLATKEQLDHVIEKFWKREPHVVVKIASDKLPGQLVYETNPGGSTKYYHLYHGYVPIDAVIEAKASP